MYKSTVGSVVSIFRKKSSDLRPPVTKWFFRRRYDMDIMVGRLKLNENIEFSVANDILSFTGPQGIWQSSVVLELPDGKSACSTLTVKFYLLL